MTGRAYPRSQDPLQLLHDRIHAQLQLMALTPEESRLLDERNAPVRGATVPIAHARMVRAFGAAAGTLQTLRDRLTPKGIKNLRAETLLQLVLACDMAPQAVLGVLNPDQSLYADLVAIASPRYAASAETYDRMIDYLAAVIHEARGLPSEEAKQAFFDLLSASLERNAARARLAAAPTASAAT